MTRRRAAGAVVALALAATGCGQVAPAPGGSDGGPSTGPAVTSTTSDTSGGASDPAASATGAPTGTRGTCAQLAESLDARERAGQLVMAGVTGTLDGAERAVIREHALGSVILMGKSQLGVSGTAEITSELSQLNAALPLLVAVDQEGGLVQRLNGPGFDAMPTAAEQAKLSNRELRAKAATWATQMRQAGVHLDLAPVADVVPKGKESTNEPVAKLRRGFGSDPAVVSEKVTAFIEGLHDAQLGAAVKHFPGLGEVSGNTDFSAKVTDTVTTRSSRALTTFRAAVEADVDALMVSTVYYDRIDADHPAAFSKTVMAMVRDDLGYDGPIVSDDLGVAKSVQGVPASERAVRFVRAGGDLAIDVDPATAGQMAGGLAGAAADDPAFDARLTDAATRVLALKSRLGLLGCQQEG